MLTDELKQALLEQKTGTNIPWVQMIAKQLDTDPALVERIMVVTKALAKQALTPQDTSELRGLLDENTEVRNALQEWVAIEAQRRRAVEAIRTQKTFRIAASRLLDKENAAVLCGTCDHVLVCAAEERSTPERCLTIQTREVKVLRIVGNELEVVDNLPKQTRYHLPLYEF